MKLRVDETARQLKLLNSDCEVSGFTVFLQVMYRELLEFWQKLDRTI
jgi:hypothetical protein